MARDKQSKLRSHYTDHDIVFIIYCQDGNIQFVMLKGDIGTHQNPRLEIWKICSSKHDPLQHDQRCRMLKRPISNFPLATSSHPLPYRNTTNLEDSLHILGKDIKDNSYSPAICSQMPGYLIKWWVFLC